MARPQNKVKDPNNLSNLKKDKNGALTFSSETLYQYEIDRANGRLGPLAELRKIGLCLEHSPTRRERGRLLYRTRKITGKLSTLKQTKIDLFIRKMGARINKYKKNLREEGLI